MSLPLVKLFSLGVKTATKPLSKFIKNRGIAHPTFKQGCVKLGKKVHETNHQMRFYLRRKKGDKMPEYHPLNEKAYTEIGSEILGEGTVFGIAGGLLIWENARKKKKTLKNREMIGLNQMAIISMDQRIEEIEKKLSAQQ